MQGGASDNRSEAFDNMGSDRQYWATPRRSQVVAKGVVALSRLRRTDGDARACAGRRVASRTGAARGRRSWVWWRVAAWVRLAPARSARTAAPARARGYGPGSARPARPRRFAVPRGRAAAGAGFR